MLTVVFLSHFAFSILHFTVPPNDHRARLETRERRIRMGRHERDRFKPIANLAPAARDVRPPGPVQPRDRRPVVWTGGAERPRPRPRADLRIVHTHGRAALRPETPR